jgi:hypothetical protein
MTIHWKDGIYGEERSARQRRQDAVQALVAVRRRRFFYVLALAIGGVGVSVCFVLLLLAPGPAALNFFGAGMWLVAAHFGRKILVEFKEEVGARRAALAEAQDRYDAVFLRLVEFEAEQGVDGSV